jgi:hypothetical protein
VKKMHRNSGVTARRKGQEKVKNRLALSKRYEVWVEPRTIEKIHALAILFGKPQWVAVTKAVDNLYDSLFGNDQNGVNNDTSPQP